MTIQTQFSIGDVVIAKKTQRSLRSVRFIVGQIRCQTITIDGSLRMLIEYRAVGIGKDGHPSYGTWYPEKFMSRGVSR